MERETEKEVIRMHKDGKTLNELSHFFSCSPEYIRLLLKKNNVNTSLRGPITNPALALDMYINQHKTCKFIAKYFNTSPGVVSCFLKRNNIPIDYNRRKTAEDVFQERFTEKEIEKICNLYKLGKSTSDLAQKFNCSPLFISKLLKHKNIKIRNINKGKTFKTEQKHKIDRQHVKKLYEVELWGFKEIGEYYNVSQVVISRILKEEGVKIRKRGEPTTRSVAKTNQSLFTSKSYYLPSGKEIKVRGYEPQFLDFIFNNTSIKENDLEYESLEIEYLFENKKRKYYPDFFLVKNNLIVEIKSSWILELQGRDVQVAKENACRALGYEYVLVLDNDFKDIRSVLT